MDNNQPSVTRRVLAIMFGVCGAGTATYLAVQGSDIAFTALVTAVSMILGFYFGVKSN